MGEAEPDFEGCSYTSGYPPLVDGLHGGDGGGLLIRLVDVGSAVGGTTDTEIAAEDWEDVAVHLRAIFPFGRLSK